MDATRNIVDTAISTGFFTTFAEGLKTAALTDTLNAVGPFTVFAPTDEAFKKLPPGQLEALRKDTRKFTSLLKHHVVAGKLLAKDVKSGEIKNVQGGMLRVETPATGLKIDGARISQSDILAENGVIHAIDVVLMPKDMNLAAAA
jgi:uncharacterized surface protein with fasciclin (FAS1) repeats